MRGVTGATKPPGVESGRIEKAMGFGGGNGIRMWVKQV